MIPMKVSCVSLAAISLALAGLNCPVSAEESSRSVVGTWSITSLSYRILDTDERVQPFGDQVNGLIHYSPGGHMAVFLQKKNLPMPSYNDYSDAGRAQIHKEIIGAYAGTYSVDGNKVTHHISAAWRPDWVGQDQVRYVDVKGDTLTITSAPLVSVVTGKPSVSILTFVRVE
jgi:hypothetical protein